MTLRLSRAERLMAAQEFEQAVEELGSILSQVGGEDYLIRDAQHPYRFQSCNILQRR